LLYKDDYAAANIPMMPVVRGLDATLNQILTYTLALFLVTLALVPIAGMGQIYLATAVILGGTFIWKSAKLRTDYSKVAAKGLFKFSILYLALLFAAVAIDGLVSAPI
ncbi:MAG: UbiA family prenyltransferase, partial [Actinobacteria bacterium]|nr:UbiA family prenyltransferase [Actinomycetota bacterium]